MVDVVVGEVTEVRPVEVVLVVSSDLRLNMVALGSSGVLRVGWRRETENETCLKDEAFSAAKLVRTARRHFR